MINVTVVIFGFVYLYAGDGREFSAAIFGWEGLPPPASPCLPDSCIAVLAICI